MEIRDISMKTVFFYLVVIRPSYTIDTVSEIESGNP